MKKMKWFCCLAFCICAMFTGCGKHIADSDKGEGTAAMAEAADRFPEKYEKTSDSGKVKFHCQLEIPQNMTQAIPAVSAEGLYCCDREKAWALFGEGKEVMEKHEIPAEEGREPSDYYLFADDENLGIDEGISYGSGNSQYYLNIGVQDPDNQAKFAQDEVSFKSSGECIAEIKSTIEPFRRFSFRLLPFELSDNAGVGRRIYTGLLFERRTEKRKLEPGGRRVFYLCVPAKRRHSGFSRTDEYCQKYGI